MESLDFNNQVNLSYYFVNFLSLLIEIYLGVDIAKKDKERLIEIAKSKNIKIYQMLIDDMQIEYKIYSDMIIMRKKLFSSILSKESYCFKTKHL